MGSAYADAMSTAPDSTDDVAGPSAIEWWSIPEVAAALGVRDRDVRSLISDRSLVSVRRDGRAPTVPAGLIVAEGAGSAIVPGLRGTIILLGDSGFDDAEIVDWLFRSNDELGSTPVEALVALRTHAVRRAAQALGF